MADKIQLLPDSIANQIAAGEVIQRPASVLKELMENAVDAGSTEIKVILKDAGKTLIQVIDNGVGMSVTDARMSFERHATSKIREAKDLFEISTKGFRGEALPSIAAIAHVEMCSRRHTDVLGTLIKIHGSKVLKQEPCQTPPGTQISVKNLFFNVPARRKFLKSDPVELRHLMDEFVRLTLAHPDIEFHLYHNETEVHHLQKSNFRQRVVKLLGKKYNEHLVPIEEETNYVKMSGFVGKPETAKKTRGDQYLLVNKRYIRSPYLHHAIKKAYEDMIPSENHPFYVIFIDLDPAHIDVNVHPTKQEIKFEDERLIYNYVRVAVRHALGKYSVTPSLDFDQEVGFGREADRKRSDSFSDHTSEDILKKKNLERWEEMFAGMDSFKIESGSEKPLTIESDVNQGEFQTLASQETETGKVFQIHGIYLISQIKSGLVLIDQQSAHERILFEKYQAILKNSERLTQKALFPVTIELPAHEAVIFHEVLPVINALGFDVQEFGQNSFIVHGMPAQMEGLNETEVIERLLEQIKNNWMPKTGVEEQVAKAMAISTSVRRGTILSDPEIHDLVDKLFACENPYNSPSGRKCFITLELDELQKRFIE